jgi:transcriptional regulator with PAS, ATPase and Fis domain
MIALAAAFLRNENGIQKPFSLLNNPITNSKYRWLISFKNDGGNCVSLCFPMARSLHFAGRGTPFRTVWLPVQKQEELMDRARMQSSFGTEGLVAGNLKDSVRTYERALIIDALKVNGNDKRKVAKLLGISLSSLYRKLRELSIEDLDEGHVGESAAHLNEAMS